MNVTNTLLAAAVTGILGGAVGCGGSAPAPQSPEASATTPSSDMAADATGATHDCKGKNECKGKGGCKNDQHACKGHNECKGQGGCKG